MYRSCFRDIFIFTIFSYSYIPFTTAIFIFPFECLVCVMIFKCCDFERTANRGVYNFTQFSFAFAAHRIIFYSSVCSLVSFKVFISPPPFFRTPYLFYSTLCTLKLILFFFLFCLRWLTCKPLDYAESLPDICHDIAIYQNKISSSERPRLSWYTVKCM